MQTKYQDNAEMPIIAFDFDGLINIDGEDTYPQCGRPRGWSKPVINFLHKLGVKIVLWTSRDVAYNQEEEKMYDDLTPMIDFMKKNEIKYDAINKSVQFAPYHYNGRKVYAHMYVDDRGFGWYENDEVMLDVLAQFLLNVCSFSPKAAAMVRMHVKNMETEPEDWMVQGVEHWKDGDKSWAALI